MKHLLARLGRELGWWTACYTMSRTRSEEDVRVVYRRSEAVGKAALTLLPAARNAMIADMQMVFPQWNRATARRVLWQGARNLCRGFIDLYSWAVRKDELYKRIRVDGVEHLERALAAGRGFFLTTGHVGVFPFVGIPAMRRGVQYGTVARELEEHRIWAAFKDWRDTIGIVSIPADEPLRFLKNVMKVLKSGGGVMYTFDIRPDEHASVEVKFMGIKTRMLSSFARMAARTGALLLPCYVVREPDGFHHRIVYYPPFEVPREAAEADSPLAVDIIQSLSDWLSNVIAKYPSQWWWARRRWQEPNQQ